jgi:hypothetical protein
MLILLLLITTALVGLVGDAVVESIADGGQGVVALGGSIALEVGTTTTLTALTALTAGAALAWVAAIAFALGRRVEGRMAEELDERWDAQSRHNAGVEGRNKLLEYRVSELQTKLDELTDRRDALVDEIRAVRKRTSELQNVAHEQRETIIRLTHGEASEEDLVVVPEPLEDLAPQEETASGAPESDGTAEPASSGSEA